MEPDTERAGLSRALEAHTRRSNHLHEVIERATRELRVHELAHDLAANEDLQSAVRGVADMAGVEFLDEEDLRRSLAERGVSVPAQLQLRGAGRHITYGGATYSLWQDRDTDDDWVRYSLTNTFSRSDFPPFSPAPRFPGNAVAGGDRNIEVSSSGVVILRGIFT
jgi:hypothetical protein